MNAHHRKAEFAPIHAQGDIITHSQIVFGGVPRLRNEYRERVSFRRLVKRHTCDEVYRWHLLRRIRADVAESKIR